MSKLEVGDKIRILVDDHNCAAVFKGDILTVDVVEEWDVQVFSADSWWFSSEGEGTGWEKYEEAGE